MLVKLKDFCNITMGQSPESKYYSDISGFPFLQGNRTFGHKYPYIDTYTTKKTKIAISGSILMSVRAPVGDLNIAKQDVCIGRGIASLFAKDNDNEFLYYALKSNLKNILNKGNGTTYDSITIEILKDIQINVPEDKEIRNKISCILSSIDNQIEKNNAMVKRLQVLGQTLFERFSFNEKETKNIKEVAKIVWGQCPDGSNILTKETSNSIKYASGAGDIDDGKVAINPKAFTDNTRREVEKYSVCMSVAGTIGKVGITKEKISIGRAMLGVFNKNQYGLLYFTLLKYSKTMEKQAVGAIQKIINNSHLDTINVPCLSTGKLTILNNIINMCLKIEKNTIDLEYLKSKLLPLLINGQLK